MSDIVKAFPTKPGHVYLVANKALRLGEAVTTDGIAFLRWTTTPPTEPGWYWVIRNDMPKKHTLMVQVTTTSSANDTLYPFEGDDLVSFEDYTHWLGPLPVPQPPEVEEE